MHDAPPAPKDKPLSDDDKTQAEPTAESLAEMPEVDFSRAIRPNKLAGLRGDFKQAVFLERTGREHRVPRKLDQGSTSPNEAGR